MASRDRWIWHLWLSCNHPSQNNSSSPASKLNRNMGTSGLLTSQNSPNQPIIMRMTSQPEWQAMAHNCRDFKHPNRHFAAKPTETCLLWSTQPIPSRTRDLAQNRWLTASDSDRSDRCASRASVMCCLLAWRSKIRHGHSAPTSCSS